MSYYNTIISRILSIKPVQRQSMISLFWQIAYTGIGFLSTMYFAHTVGASILGAYFLFMAYYGIVTLFVDGGFGNAAVKRISEGHDSNEYLSAYFVLRTVFTILTIIFLLLLRSYFVDLRASGMFIWLIIALIVSLFGSTISNGNIGKGKNGVYYTSAAIGNISRTTIQVIAIYLGYEAAGLAGGMVAGIIVAATIEYRFFELKLTYFKYAHIKSLLIFSFWIFLASGGTLVFSQTDTIVIGYFMNTSEVGIYRVVLQFATIATFTTSALRNTLFPRVSKWSKENKFVLIENSLSRALHYSLILAIPVLIGGLLVGDKLLYYFYGEEFAEGYSVLIVLLFVQIVNVFNFFFAMYLNALDRPAETFKVTAVGVISNIFLNIVLIPIFGILGAAIATFLTMTLNALLAKYALSDMISIHLDMHGLKNIIQASFIMGIIVIGIRFMIPFSSLLVVLSDVFLGCLVYTISVLKFDRKMHNELKEISDNLGIGSLWPKWL